MEHDRQPRAPARWASDIGSDGLSGLLASDQDKSVTKPISRRTKLKWTPNIATELTKRKLKTPRGGAWHPQTVKMAMQAAGWLRQRRRPLGWLCASLRPAEQCSAHFIGPHKDLARFQTRELILK